MLWLLFLVTVAAPNKTSAPPPLVRIDTPAPPLVTTPILNPRPPAVPTWNYKQWVALDLGDSTFASTKNASQSAFGVVCGKSCVWFVNFQKDCTEGHQYPAMINSPSGSGAITLRCYHLGDRRLLTYKMDDDSIDMLVKGGEIGFAFPLDGGQFGVSRFSLSGGAEAVLKAIDLIVAKRNARQEGLRDFTI